MVDFNYFFYVFQTNPDYYNGVILFIKYFLFSICYFVSGVTYTVTNYLRYFRHQVQHLPLRRFLSGILVYNMIFLQLVVIAPCFDFSDEENQYTVWYNYHIRWSLFH